MNIANIREKFKGMHFGEKEDQEIKQSANLTAFKAIVQKEFTDSIRSFRIIILLTIILLACFGSLYTAVTAINDTLDSGAAEEIGGNSHLFLQLFTISDGTLPSFITFVGFLGPLFGIALGFDAINSERNRGTLSRLMAQPIPRDYVINAKFIAALLLNIILFLTLGFIVTALGILILGIPPTLEEAIRIFIFLFLCIVYIAFWLNLSILFSIVFKNAATSALASIAVWIFFQIFYSMIVQLVARSLISSTQPSNVEEVLGNQELLLNIMRLSPSYLFNESTTILLSPSVRSLGPLSMEQVVGAVAGPLPLNQSLLLIWPQLTGLIAATLVCFTIAYVIFMRQEIRSN